MSRRFAGRRRARTLRFPAASGPGRNADPVTPEHIAQLEAHIAALQGENLALRQELERIHAHAEAVAAARATVLRGGARLLVPLLDRQRVVRSFSKLAGTMSAFAGPMQQWPQREQVLGDAREFMESCVRFVIRRRLFMLLFALLAAAIPFIQILLVVQQNEIIENQNEFAKIQVYDVVSRSMTEGDRNARLMTGALLSNADPEFLRAVIEEAFNPDLAGTYRKEGIAAETRRLEDAAFRGYLARAVVRGVEHRAPKERARVLWDQTQPMLRWILTDAESRVSAILVLGEGTTPIEAELAEQVDHYLVQVGVAAGLYARLARSVDDMDTFHADLLPLLERVSTLSVRGNQFEEAYRYAVERLLFEMALEPKLGETMPDPSAGDASPEQVLARGLERLREGLGTDRVRWQGLEKQVTGR
jgi:hypothetical protein